jgi:modulator of FtsH protease HflK
MPPDLPDLGPAAALDNTRAYRLYRAAPGKVERMFWKSQGGGPWGSGPRGGGPWGGGPRGGDNSGGHGGPGPRGRSPIPPDFEELLRRGQERFRQVLPGGFGTGSGIAIVVAAIVVIWLATGFYRVLPDQVGIVLRFGAYNRTTQPGLNYHLPSPIESVMTPAVTRVNRIEIGYRTGEGVHANATEQVPQEALMLTGDENIVDINFAVFWVISDARRYLFDIRDPEMTVKSAAESAMREVIGETPIASALAEGRGKIENETEQLLQQLLNDYGAGIEVTQVQLQRVDPPGPVIDAFRDVQRALADRARLRNVAESYRNTIVPQARGNAVAIEQQAQAYRQQIVARAQGDAARFDQVYQAFKATQDVTTERIYLETMEDILKNSNKVIIDKSAEGANGVLPYLPLPALRGGGSAPAASSATPAPQAPTGSGQ